MFIPVIPFNIAYPEQVLRRGGRERVPALRAEGRAVQRPGQGGEHLGGPHHRQPRQEAAAAHGAPGTRRPARQWRRRRRRQVRPAAVCTRAAAVGPLRRGRGLSLCACALPLLMVLCKHTQ
jgi:hypothetical protein